MSRRFDELFAAYAEGLRASLRVYDRENANAPDRHPTACECHLCEYVERQREWLRDWDGSQGGTE